jgi:glycosyltransferase involved in cell wall biosynthesis
MVDAHSLGAMTVSTLCGEAGRQRGEVERLVRFLSERPRFDAVCLSNAMLIGLARSLKQALGCPLVCSLQGEAPFLDALPEPWRDSAWRELAERSSAIDAFVPVSAHYGELMRARLRLPAERMHVVHNGIELDGFAPAAGADGPPTIGYLARMCPEKGLHTLIDAFVLLKRRGTLPHLHLSVAGTCVRADEQYVEAQRAKLEAAGCAADAEFFPNIEREEKLRFLAALSVLSVPATYGESFGLYVLEALAAGVPVVQPRHGAFPEVLAATGGGTLVEPDDAQSLADGLEQLLRDPERRSALGATGRAAVLERFGVERMAREFAAVCAQASAVARPA